ncbi:MAG: TraB/GumN family protein [Rhodanobacteraceae bacterium]
MAPVSRLAIAILVLGSTVASARANPALWVTRSPTAVVYVFGTMHVLPKGAHWHFPALDRALAASRSLYVEEDDESHVETEALILKYGITPVDRANVKAMLNFDSVYTNDVTVMGNPYVLSGEMDSSDQAKLRTAVTQSRITDGMTMVQAMKPWLAALILANAAMRGAGYEPTFGVDSKLEREFRAQHKPVHSLETAQDQITLFAKAPHSVQLDLLKAVLGDRTRGYVQVAQLAHDWLAGNAAAIASALNGSLRSDYPALYATLIVQRNRYFAQRIKKLLDRHGTFFVAIGAAHLAGPDSVQVQLEKLGVDTSRVH